MRKNIIFRALAKAGVLSYMSDSSRRKVGLSACPDSLDEFAISHSKKDPTEFYRKCVAYFDKHLPDDLKAHRAYFRQNQRGFGEDAFHVRWSLLVYLYQPVNFLEIGVYRGQVLSLVTLLQKLRGLESRNTGLGPFERVGDDASVGAYGYCTDWLEDIRTNVSHFGLKQPELVKAYSTEDHAVSVIKGADWDMIYIDGNHDYEVVIEDWNNCSESVRVGGVIVLDDAGMDSGFRAPLFATAGFPGPSKVANSVDTSGFKEVLQVGHNRAFERIN